MDMNTTEIAQCITLTLMLLIFVHGRTGFFSFLIRYGFNSVYFLNDWWAFGFVDKRKKTKETKNHSMSLVKATGVFGILC